MATFADEFASKVKVHPVLRGLTDEVVAILTGEGGFTSWKALNAYGKDGLVADYGVPADKVDALLRKAASEMANEPAVVEQTTVTGVMAVGEQAAPVNKWASVEVTSDADLAAYAAGTGLKPEDAKRVVNVGLLNKIVALEQCGARAAIIDVGKLADSDDNTVQIGDELNELIFPWFRMVQNNDPRIATMAERKKVLARIEGVIPPDLDTMLQSSARYGSARTDLKALGAGATFDINSVKMSLGDIAAQLPDVLEDALKTLRRGNLVQYYKLLIDEYTQYIFPILDSADFQILCRIKPDMTNPKLTAMTALEQAGYPMAGAALDWGNHQRELWGFLALIQPDDTDFVIELGNRARKVLAANARLNREIEKLEKKGAVTVAPSGNGDSFRHAPANVAEVAAAPVPTGFRVFGFSVTITKVSR